MVPPGQMVSSGQIVPQGQGHDPSLNGRFFHQKAGCSLMKIGEGLIANQQAGSSLIKIGNGKIRDLTGDVRFPEVDHVG